ncbi:MAG TPA: glycosyltransferase [Casimicrobiaceae bacterium]|nr:glycosyltransferase [Casimicrobiaceae bacterium]
MTVDVIVPIYRGGASARRCIESISASPQQTPFELVVVNDGSPEADLVRWLREAHERGRVTLIEQPSRQGFAAAVNRAATLHRDRDVVIVHSDAEVANDWLDRLAVHAAAHREVGTVSPFASYGGVAGYPRSGVKNTLPDGYTLAELDLLFRRANRAVSVNVPLSCGPCVYVRRECLESVGPFDSSALGSDHGVEQDFSLRAASTGFRHVLAADVYVWHHGEASFGEAEAMELSARAEKALGKLYPNYRSQRTEFVRRDPARPSQRRVDLLRLAESPRQLLLFITHGWGGGIRRHMNELAAMIADRCDVLFLEPGAGDTVKLSWPKAGEGFALYYELPRDMRELVSCLRELGLARLHFHHVHGLPRAVLDLPGAIGVPYDCTLHDYYSICPQYHLVTEDGRYCGEPDTVGCTACLTRRPGLWGLDIVAWRGAFGTLLRGADRVFAPSRDVAQRISRYFPDVKATVMPHPEAEISAFRRVTRVVTLGNLSPDKGLDVVAACAADARKRDLPLSFRVLGPTTKPLPQWPGVALSTHGQYAEGDLPLLIGAERPDVIWFPAQVPETYSYTLSTALASGAAIVASALGAFPERLAGYSRALLVPWNATPAEWNDALLKAASTTQAVRAAQPRMATT